ncbi:MAG: amino acid permease [Bacillota bacterium]|nr:amino acid permease [Bacillota bacterium]
MSKRAEVLEVEPLRNLGFWEIWAIGVGAVVGDGIFLLIGQGIATAGPGSLFSYLLAGVFLACLMIALGELAVGMPRAGAMSVWVQRFMGDWWGFLSGFAFALGWVIAGGSVGLAIGRITTWFFPQLDQQLWTIIFGVGWLTLFALFNIAGVGLSGKVQLWMTVALVALMTAFALFGARSVNPANFSPWFPTGFSGFLAAVPLGTYAYMGAVTLATAGSECRKPIDLPRGLVWSSITFLVLYTAAHLVALGIVPWTEVTMEQSPFTKAAGVAFGYAGAFVINLAAWLAAATCLHMGTLYSTSRVFWEQAHQGYLPAFFGYLHPRTRTPVWGIIFIWAVSVLLILLGVRNPDLIYVHLSLQLVLAWLVSWFLAVVGAMLFRSRFPQEIQKLPWRQPLYPLLPIVGIAGMAVVLWGTFVGAPQALLWGLAWIVGLWVYFRLYVRGRKSYRVTPPQGGAAA